jgi:ketosteroid isomerase-like protein
MRSTLKVSLLVLVGAGLLPGCRARPGFTAADRQAIEAVLERQRQAWNRGDLPGYMDGYARSPALVFTSGGKIRRGWDQTLAAYQKRYGGDRAGMGQLAFEVLEVQDIGADGAVMLGRWRLTGTPQAGAGIFSIVFQRLPDVDGWRIVHDHSSTDGP